MLALLQIAAAVSVLQGRVVEWQSATPVPQVEVELRLRDDADAAPRVAVSDRQGEFRFLDVPPGSYRLLALRDGFTLGEYGQRRPNGSGVPVRIVAGQSVSGITLSMVCGGAISGRITDNNGKLIGRANVSAVRLTTVNGMPVLTTFQSTITDDRGEYRLFWLPPGEYYVCLLYTSPSPRDS